MTPAEFQAMYSIEVEERVPVDIDLELPTNEQAIWIENAYRRGFYQGVSQALNAVEKKIPKTVHGRFFDWLFNRLYVWRYDEHHGVPQMPPEY